MELMYETLYLLRNKYHFRGYIHAKAVPGADAAIIEEVGYLADRMSVNMELPTADSLHTLAPGKTHEAILKPMKQIQNQIVSHRLALGQSPSMERHYGTRYLSGSIFSKSMTPLEDRASVENQNRKTLPASRTSPFVPAGQSTQISLAQHRKMIMSS